jgi:hypothetical protein
MALVPIAWMISSWSPTHPTFGDVCPFSKVPELMTCDDKKEKCILDCVLSVYLGEIDQEKGLGGCRATCLQEHTSCVDPTEIADATEVSAAPPSCLSIA